MFGCGKSPKPLFAGALVSAVYSSPLIPRGGRGEVSNRKTLPSQNARSAFRRIWRITTLGHFPPAPNFAAIASRVAVVEPSVVETGRASALRWRPPRERNHIRLIAMSFLSH